MTRTSTDSLRFAVFVLIVVMLILSIDLPLTATMLVLIPAAIKFRIIGSLYLSKTVLECDGGTEAMRQVSDPIREGKAF